MGNRLYLTYKNRLNCQILIEGLKKLGRLLDTLECEKICFSALLEGNNEETFEKKSVSIFHILQRHRIPVELQPEKGELLSLGVVCFLAVFGEWKTEKASGCLIQTVLEKDENGAMIKLLLCSDTEVSEKEKDTVQVLETNVDDCSGEQLGYAIECLMKAGALDASCFPVYMKKNRVAYMLQVLCKKEQQEVLEDIIFRETTSIGLRRYEEKRRILPRTFKEIVYKVTVKVCEHHGQKFCYPEFETVKRVCEETGRAYRDIYDEASAVAGGYYENL